MGVMTLYTSHHVQLAVGYSKVQGGASTVVLREEVWVSLGL